MPHDETLAARVRKALARRKNLTEKKMFGGVCFMLSGNMCTGIWKEFLILRVGPDQYDSALGEPNVRVFDVTGRPMRGWVMVAPEAIETDEELKAWLKRATAFASSLPPK